MSPPHQAQQRVYECLHAICEHLRPVERAPSPRLPLPHRLTPSLQGAQVSRAPFQGAAAAVPRLWAASQVGVPWPHSTATACVQPRVPRPHAIATACVRENFPWPRAVSRPRLVHFPSQMTRGGVYIGDGGGTLSPFRRRSAARRMPSRCRSRTAGSFMALRPPSIALRRRSGSSIACPRHFTRFSVAPVKTFSRSAPP